MRPDAREIRQLDRDKLWPPARIRRANAAPGLILPPKSGIGPPNRSGLTPAWSQIPERAMKVRNSLKSLRSRHRDNQIVRRKGRVYIINKTQKRYKARQG